MTNTPMTSREAFEEYYKRTENPDADFTRYAPDSYAYKDDAIDEFWYPWDDAWQASQAQQAQVIAELVEALDFMERHAAIYPSHPRRVSVRELIAKVKGQTT